MQAHRVTGIVPEGQRQEPSTHSGELSASPQDPPAVPEAQAAGRPMHSATGASWDEGTSVEGASVEGTSVEATSVEGASVEGASVEGASVEGTSAEGTSRATSIEGTSVEGASVEVTSG
jgi:hypothetical protein